MEIAQELAGTLSARDIVALQGPLGCGKTVFVRGMARALGVEEPVTSPSFTLVHEYRGRLPVYHVDLYRIQEETELSLLALEEYFEARGVTVIEWSDRLGNRLPDRATEVSMRPTGPRRRIIEIAGHENHDASKPH